MITANDLRNAPMSAKLQFAVDVSWDSNIFRSIDNRDTALDFIVHTYVTAFGYQVSEYFTVTDAYIRLELDGYYF